jgi:exonuclease III
VRIATFNINNVNRRLPNLLRWLAASAPDVVCLQEKKCTHGDFSVDAIRKAGYHAVWKGERSWNGVAILARKREPILIRDMLPGDVDDRQSRYIEAAVEGIAVASIYLPNGNPQPGPKFNYKLKWFDRLYEHATALLQPAPRAAYAKLLAAGWTDALRTRSSWRRLRLSQIGSGSQSRWRPNRSWYGGQRWMQRNNPCNKRMSQASTLALRKASFCRQRSVTISEISDISGFSLRTRWISSPRQSPLQS